MRWPTWPPTLKERGSAAARDAQFARPRGTARGHARGRRHVGRRRFLGDGGAAEGRGLRRRRRHAAALRPRRGDPPQGRLLRRPGHPRRPRGRRAHRHPALRARLREPLQGDGDRPFAASYVAGETPVPCVHCNKSIKFKDLLVDRARSRRRVLATGHYVASRPLPDGGRALYRAARCRARPELFPVRHHAASSSTSCAFRSAT